MNNKLPNSFVEGLKRDYENYDDDLTPEENFDRFLREYWVQLLEED